MGTTLENGVYLPSEGERNCYAGLKTNWEILDQKVADVTALQQAVAGALRREIVESLPTTDIDPNTIYMILSGTSATENVYNEYMYVNNAWELIGTSATDLTNYYTKGDVDGLLLLKANASDLTSHTGDTTIHVTTADKNKWNNQSVKNVVTNNQTIKSTGITRGTAPSSAQTFGIAFSDNNNKYIGNIYGLFATDMSTSVGLYAYKGSTTANSDNVSVRVGYDASGNAYTYAPTPATTDNSTQIATTAFVKAHDSNVVHNSGNETVGGVKTFADVPVFTSFDGIRFRCAHNSNAYITFRNVNQANPGSLILSAHDGSVGTAIHLVDKTLIPYNNNDTDLGSSSKLWKDLYAYHGYIRGQQQNDEYSGNARTNLTLLANRDTIGQSGCLVDTFRENTAQGTGNHILGFGIKENSVRYEGCRFSWFYDNNNNGYVFALRPTTQGTNQPIKYELGNSSSKWSTINGINPGALGMPDLSNGIDISSYITVPNAVSTYTPSVNGWISIVLKSTSGAVGCFATQGDFANGHYGATALVSETEPCVMLSMPVIGGIAVNINTKGSNAYVYSAKFYPCQGNV